MWWQKLGLFVAELIAAAAVDYLIGRKIEKHCEDAVHNAVDDRLNHIERMVVNG